MCQRKSHYQDLMKGGTPGQRRCHCKLSQEPRSGGRFLNLAVGKLAFNLVNPMNHPTNEAFGFMNHPTWSIPNKPNWESLRIGLTTSFGSIWTFSRKKTGTSEALFVSRFFTLYLLVSLPVFSLAISLFISLYFSSILPIPLLLSWFFFPSPYVSPWFISLAISPFIIFGGTSHPRFPPPFCILVSGIVHLQWMPSEPVKNQKTMCGAADSPVGHDMEAEHPAAQHLFFSPGHWLRQSLSPPTVHSLFVCVCAKRSVPHREGCGNGSWLTLPTNRSDLISTGRKMWKRGMSGEGHLAFGLGFKLILTSSAGKTTKDVFSLNGGPCHFSRTKCRTTWQDAPSIDLCPQGCMVYMHTQTIYRSVNCH